MMMMSLTQGKLKLNYVTFIIESALMKFSKMEMSALSYLKTATSLKTELLTQEKNNGTIRLSAESVTL
jgi:hypothetical protein